MTPDNETKWLVEHIPHRVHASLARLPLQNDIIRDLGKDPRRFMERCDYDAIMQGRLAGIRWLIEFIGLSDYRGKPDRPNRKPKDISIIQIQGGKEIDLSLPEAEKLRKVWLGCSQATGHPTDGSNHPPVDEKALDEATRIIVNHLDSTIYAAAQRRLADVLSA